MKSFCFKIVFCCVITFFSNENFSQNQFHLSQYMIHQPLINPASMGGFNSLNAALFYRTQWIGFGGAPRVTGFNINTPFKKNSRVGGSLIYDKIGVNQIFDISADYGYVIPFSFKSKLTLGLSLTMRLIQANYSNLETTDGTDPLFDANLPSTIAPNGKFGIYYTHKKFYLGFVARNLIHNQASAINTNISVTNEFDLNKNHYFAHIGYKFVLSAKNYITASSLIKKVGGAPLQAEITSLFGITSAIAIGATYRTSNDLVGIIKFNINKKITAAYSFDFTMSKLGKLSSGTHEIMIIFDNLRTINKPINQSPRF